MLLRLNNTDVTKKSAQSASCLKPKDFKKVYNTIRTVLEENEKALNTSYETLHAHYKSGVQFDFLRSFLIEVENEMIPRGSFGADNVLMKYAVYFWVLNCVKVCLAIHAYSSILMFYVSRVQYLRPKPLLKRIVFPSKNSSTY